ncbi:MAG: hypothetical protein HPY59_12740 [Anaerolineae bacterium]|nr:hypothetical protein [Anaerolineae bacterium]
MKKKGSSTEIFSTYQQHKRQATWQIILPLILAAAILLAIGVLASIGTFNEPALGTRWAGISMIILIIPILLGGGIFAVLITVLIYGLAKLYQVVPIYSLIARSYALKSAFFVRQWSDRMVRPFFLPKIIQASLHSFFSSLKNPRDHYS